MFLCGTDIMKGVYYALVLTVRKPRKFSKQVRNKATVDAPWVCYIHTYYALIAIGVSVHQWNYRCRGLLYITAWGFDVVRFDRIGSPRASDRGASDSSGASRLFLCLNPSTFENTLRLWSLGRK